MYKSKCSLVFFSFLFFGCHGKIEGSSCFSSASKIFLAEYDFSNSNSEVNIPNLIDPWTAQNQGKLKNETTDE